MNIREGLSILFGRKQTDEDRSRYIEAVVRRLQSGRPLAPAKDFAGLVERYKSWVYACANKNASNVAQIPLRLYVSKSAPKSVRRQTKEVDKAMKDFIFASPTLQPWTAKAIDIEEVVEHPFLDLMRNINPFMNGFDFRETVQLFLELTGNAYIYVLKGGLGTPAELWVIPSQGMKIVPSRETFIKGYVYGREPDRVAYEPDEIIHLKFPNPESVYYGKGPLAAAAAAADIKFAMDDYEAALFDNNARPDFALISEGGLTDDQIKQLRNEWSRLYRGRKKSGKPAVLAGGLDIKELSFSPRELGFLVGRKITREEVAGIFGVPQSKLVSADVNRANAEAGNYTYMQDTILPRLRRVEQKLNEQLMPMFDGRFFCAFDNPVPEDKEFILKERETNLKTLLTAVNEERAKMGLEPAPWGEVPIAPVNVIPLGSLPPVTEGQKGFPAIRAKEDTMSKGPVQFVEALQDYFRKQARAFIARMKPVKVIDEDIEVWINGFTWEEWIKILEEDSKPFVAQAVVNGGKTGIARVAAGTAFNTENPKVYEFIKRHTYEFSFEVNDISRRRLRATLIDGMRSGEGLPEMKQRVADLFGTMEKYRADRIVRTEVSRATHAGTELGYMQSGVVEGKEWGASSDACPFCLELNGRIVELGQPYFAKGDALTVQPEEQEITMNFDYADVGHPPLHPFCKCTLLPVLKEV